jgi:hypothetical protein
MVGVLGEPQAQDQSSFYRDVGKSNLINGGRLLLKGLFDYTKPLLDCSGLS